MRMTQFFAFLPGNASIGSFVYAQSVLRYYYQNFLSGMVEIDAPAERFVFLFSDGCLVGAYRWEGEAFTLVLKEQLADYWKSGEARIRSINLPREAVRAVKNGLEWSPPESKGELTSSTLPGYLLECRSKGGNGILQLVWERAEGYLSIYRGEIELQDTVFATSSSVYSGGENYRRILSEKGTVCRASFYSGKEDSPAYQQYALRYALKNWVSFVLQRYSAIVGRSLADSLAAEINGLMRSKSYYIRLTGESIFDMHIFESVELGVKSYRELMRAMALHIGKVIGATLTQSILNEAFQKIRSEEMQVLSRHVLVPALIASPSIE
jgi:hypothetical protein